MEQTLVTFGVQPGKLEQKSKQTTSVSALFTLIDAVPQ